MKIFKALSWEKINNSQVTIYGIIIFVVGLLFLYGRYQKRNETDRRNEIKTNFTIVGGKVETLKKVYKNHDRFEYTFYFNNNWYSGWSTSNGKATDYINLSGHLSDKFFPVILSRKDPQKYSSILIVPEDFKAYGLNFPDSLRWVLTYIDR